MNEKNITRFRVSTYTKTERKFLEEISSKLNLDTVQAIELFINENKKKLWS